jgi:DNA-binding winged helix-turn-helix (wHTH) protein
MQNPARLRNGYRVGQYLVDADSGELYEKGTRVRRLRPQTHKLLMVLLSNAGEIVKTPVLMDALWKGTNIACPQDGLKKAIGWLREDLNDAPEKPRYIERVPRTAGCLAG